MVKKNTLLICSLAFFSLMGCKGKNELTVPVNLRTEYLREPIGLDTKSPRFTWEYKGSEKNFLASRSEIRIGTSPDNLQPYTDNMTLEPHTRYYWNVTVWDQDGDICETSETATFETAKFKSSDWSGKWITDSHDKEFEPAPMFRKAFTLGKEIEEARVYVAAAGYYDLFINGKRVGENYLDPGYTHFDKRILYVTHDVTSLLKPGGNAIATVLGNGWHNVQSKAVWNFETARWRNRPRMLCELRLRYTDGTTEVIATDESWHTATGPYTYNNIYSGDKYDATLEENGWNAEGFDDSKWDPVQVTEAPAPLLAAQQMPGIRITEELQPVSMKKFSDKLYVFSFEKNFAGLSRLKVKGAPGTRITLKHGELLKTDGRLEQGNIDVYYHPVKPGEVFQMDVFTLKGTGEEEIFMPSFAYHGFQHVEVESSAPVVLTKESLTGLFMHTAVEPVGSFSCSDPLLNKIWKATMEAYRSNLHSIPTDCPQREKNGWTADAHVAIDLGLLGFDAITLYEKWLADHRDNMYENGRLHCIIPSGGWGSDIVDWTCSVTLIPWAIYEFYGDQTCLRDNYTEMKRHTDYWLSKFPEGLVGDAGLGDWVPHKAVANRELSASIYHYKNADIMSRTAKLFGYEEEYKYYKNEAEKIKAAINNKYLNKETGIYASGYQTEQSMPLYWGIVPEELKAKVEERLSERVHMNKDHLDFGIMGCKTVLNALTESGHVEQAFRIVTQQDYPSWGNWLRQGATTLFENWDYNGLAWGYSQNHIMYGEIGAWFYKALAGINLDPQQPGFKNILLKPHFVKELTYVKASYHSPYGEIISAWKRVGDKVIYQVTIPANTTATLYLEHKDVPKTLSSGSYEFKIK